MVTGREALEAALNYMDGEFESGVRDCCRGPASAFKALWGRETMAGLSYRCEETARALLEENGGLLRLAVRQFKESGLRRSLEHPGAIGILRVEHAHVGGLCIAPGEWAVKADRGVAFHKSPVTVWGV